MKRGNLYTCARTNNCNKLVLGERGKAGVETGYADLPKCRRISSFVSVLPFHSIAQHLDDCAESFLMSIMHNGFIRTMKANYKINAGDVSVIRPLVYCRESLMTEFVSGLVLLLLYPLLSGFSIR